MRDESFISILSDPADKSLARAVGDGGGCLAGATGNANFFPTSLIPHPSSLIPLAFRLLLFSYFA